MKASSKAAQEPVKFEAALGSLEEIVAAMEEGALPLDQLIERYEEGMRLVGLCRERLAEAEQKIEILTRRAEKTPAPELAAEPPPLF
jgi:exodeoxyribonuclease VII small subunit